MRDTIIFSLFIIIGLSSCLDSDLTATDKLADARINYLDDQSDFDQLVNDPYRIIGINPLDGHLNIILEYSGGCKSHRFSAVAILNNDSLNHVKLYHHSDNDLCEALVRDTVQLSLEEVFDQYDPSLDMLVRNASNQQTVTIDQDLAAIVQSQFCELMAIGIEDKCASGVFGNQLFTIETQDSTKVWLQPVRNETEYSGIRPGIEYKLGVSLIFGFDYGLQTASACDAPSPVVAAVVHCISE